MNTHIERIKAIDAILAKMIKIKQQGEALAAGIRIDLRVGANEDAEEVTMDFGLTSDIQGILDCLIAGLKESRSHRYRWANQERDELVAFLGSPKD
jgi:hypothetical protein